MKKSDDIPRWYFVDEAGDPSFYAAGKKLIVGTEGCSRTFSLGFIRTRDPQQIRAKLAEARLAIAQDSYLKGIPSLPTSLIAFHAKDDCPEVRHIVYQTLMKSEFYAQIVVARKIPDIFRDHFKDSQDLLYDRLVSRLFKNQLHRSSQNTVVFARRGNKDRQHSLREAVQFATKEFTESGGAIEIAIETSQPMQEPVLQAADYVMWAIQRAYERQEMRYFEFIRERVELLSDIYDLAKREKHAPGETVFYDREKNPFDIKKTSPLS